jgi:tetratricopeptide (TPR) repeat protein
VLVSGQAAAALSLEAPRQLFFLDEEPVAAPSGGDAFRLFDGCVDLQEIDVPSDDVATALERAWAVDRALRIFLFLLDPQEPEEELHGYAECIEDLITTYDLASVIVERMSTEQFPVMVEVKRVQLASDKFPRVLELFNKILGLQGHIVKVQNAFANVSEAFFDSEVDKANLLGDLKAEGVFSEFAIALQQGNDISFTKLKAANRHLAYREAIAQWTAMLQSGSTRLPRNKNNGRDDLSDDELAWETDEDLQRPSSYGAYQYVRAEQVEIVQLLKLRELGAARAKTDTLVDRQRVNSTAEQIAKTLSLLAQQAKLQDIPELQLEWSERATLENPADPRTFGHFADALITVGRLAEAEAALDGAERAGGRLFAECGRARILSLLSHYEQARNKYLEVAREFDDLPGVEYAWSGAADVLKDMGRLDEAIAEYQGLTNRWPLSSQLWNGLAFVLIEAGRLDEAVLTFGKSSAQRPNIFAAVGRASAFRLSGRLTEALRLYDEAIENYPNNHFALCGRAEVFRVKGQHQLALAAFDLAAARSPFVAEPLVGRAAALTDLGSLREARTLYESVIERFPHDLAAPIGLIRVLIRMGDLETALRKSDALIARHPFLASAKTLRAQILNAQGFGDAALVALDVVTAHHPHNAGVATAKASLLISMGRSKEAASLLPDMRPKTQSDWARYLLRALVLQSANGPGAAALKLEWAIANCPFFSQRRKFRDALVSLELNRGRWRDARRVVERAPTETSDVMALHAYAASHRSGAARTMLEKIKASEPSARIIELATEIARRTKLIDEAPLHPNRWIGEAERRVILLEAA